MQPVTQTYPVSKKTLWAGYIMGALPVRLLLMSAVMKLIKPPPVVEGFAHLGLPESLALGLGMLELACIGRLCDSADVRPRRDPGDRLSRGRDRHASARGRSFLHARYPRHTEFAADFICAMPG
jgi:DoxX-like family